MEPTNVLSCGAQERGSVFVPPVRMEAEQQLQGEEAVALPAAPTHVLASRLLEPASTAAAKSIWQRSVDSTEMP